MLRITTMVWLMTMLLLRFDADWKEHIFKSTCSVVVICICAGYLMFLIKEIINNRRQVGAVRQDVTRDGSQ